MIDHLKSLCISHAQYSAALFLAAKSNKNGLVGCFFMHKEGLQGTIHASLRVVEEHVHIRDILTHLMTSTNAC